MRTKQSAISLIEVLIVIAIINVLLSLSLPAVQSSREAARRLQCVNNLKQIGLALQDYHAVHTHFPAGSVIKIPQQCVGVDCRGTGMFVLLLPHLDEINWQTGYDFSHPNGWLGWSEENGDQAVLEFGMPVYRCPSETIWYKLPHRRLYFGVAGGETRIARGFRGDVYKDGLFAINRNRSFRHITDGTSKTIAVGESSHSVVSGLTYEGADPSVGTPAAWWFGTACYHEGDSCIPERESFGRVMLTTKYEPNSDITPLSLDLANDVPFASHHPNQVQFVFADGHVAAIDDQIDLGVYRALSTIAGGEILQGDN